MSDPYQIVEVQPEWRLEPEEMGSKKKFWYRPLKEQEIDWHFKYSQPSTGQHWSEKIAELPGTLPKKQEANWLFKYPQPSTGQHWSEKIAAEVAGLLEIPHAKVELAVFAGERGSVTESFVRDGQELVHGNQVLSGIVDLYDPAVKFRQSRHTLSNIWQAMDSVFVEQETARKAKFRMAEYTILDALIGNTDRHHENWGILRKRMVNHWKGFVAPSFDHASSLGRELLDERRERRLAEDSIGDYVEKGRGAIYWSEVEHHGPNPLELVRRASREYPDIFRPALAKLQGLDSSSIRDIVKRVPDDWMTSTSREFAIALICYNSKQLGGLI